MTTWRRSAIGCLGVDNAPIPVLSDKGARVRASFDLVFDSFDASIGAAAQTGSAH